MERFDEIWTVFLSNGPNSLGFVEVSAADAEKVVELKQVRLQAKIKLARVNRSPDLGIYLRLADVEIEGKKWTPQTEFGAKGKGPKKGP